MNDIEISLLRELLDREYAEAYAESFLNAYVATQIKAIREQRGMTQADLAERVGTTQAGISRVENVNYSAWSVRTLKKIAQALDVRLKVSFETYGTLSHEVVSFDRSSLERADRMEDPILLQAWSKSPAVQEIDFKLWTPTEAWQPSSAETGQASYGKALLESGGQSPSGYARSSEQSTRLTGFEQQKVGGYEAICA